MNGERIVLLGAGSWGTALAIGLAQHDVDTVLWTRKEAHAKAMLETRLNAGYLPQATLPSSLAITADLEVALQDRTMWVFAAPSQAVRDVAVQAASAATADILAMSVAKGIENETLLLTTQVLEETLLILPRANIGVIYGPSHAEEVALGMPTTVVAAAHSVAAAERVQKAFMSPKLRVYVNEDVIGVQVAGSVKNIMAIAAGISDGIGFGDNAKAAIITRGLAEMKRLGQAMGAEASTFAGLAGIGDLVVTCMSRHSRNRHVGEQIGKGRSLDEIIAEMNMVAEGVKTTRSVMALAKKHNVELPITEAVHAILFEGKSPKEEVARLMRRAAKREDWLEG